MKLPARRFPFTIALGIMALGAIAQDAPPRAPRTIEERVAALEAGLATLDTRAASAAARSPELGGPSELALAGRIAALERSVERLAADLQRVERLADAAGRAAADAQRDAARAEQTARDAALRTR